MYIIKERWRVMGQIETYENERKTVTQVKKYIKDWLDSWKDNAQENNYKFLGLRTDFKTFAKCRIQTGKSEWGNMIDTFSLVVKSSRAKPKKIYVE